MIMFLGQKTIDTWGRIPLLKLIVKNMLPTNSQCSRRVHSYDKMHRHVGTPLKWQSLSFDYRFLMLILLNHYMLIEFPWYLHDNKWF